MKRFLKEPLLHFLLLGAAIFAAYCLVSKRSSGEPGTRSRNDSTGGSRASRGNASCCSASSAISCSDITGIRPVRPVRSVRLRTLSKTGPNPEITNVHAAPADRTSLEPCGPPPPGVPPEPVPYSAFSFTFVSLVSFCKSPTVPISVNLRRSAVRN